MLKPKRQDKFASVARQLLRRFSQYFASQVSVLGIFKRVLLRNERNLRIFVRTSQKEKEKYLEASIGGSKCS